MLGLMWGFESELYADPNPEGYASIDQYGSAIKLYNDPHELWLHLIMRGS